MWYLQCIIKKLKSLMWCLCEPLYQTEKRQSTVCGIYVIHSISHQKSMKSARVHCDLFVIHHINGHGDIYVLIVQCVIFVIFWVTNSSRWPFRDTSHKWTRWHLCVDCPMCPFRDILSYQEFTVTFLWYITWIDTVTFMCWLSNVSFMWYFESPRVHGDLFVTPLPSDVSFSCPF